MFAGATASPTSQKKKNVINVTGDQLNSIQQGLPVLWFAGRRYIAAQRLSACYNQVNSPVKVKSGKDSTTTSTYIYFADFGLMWCVCGRRHPLDAIYKVILDNEIHWSNNAGIHRASADYVDVTTKNGTLRLYWGTGTQGIDPLVFTTRGQIPIDPNFNKNDPSTWPNNDPGGGGGMGQGGAGNTAAGDSNPLSGHYDKHGGYHYQAYSVQKKWRLGKGRTNVQQFVLELARGVPWFAADTTIDRGAMGLDFNNDGVNLIGAIYELETDDVIGLGKADSQLHQASWESALQYFANNNVRFSPMLDNQQDVKSMLTKLYEYGDLYRRDYDGLDGIGFWDRGPIVINNLPLLTDDDLDGESEVVPGDVMDLTQRLVVNFDDQNHHYNERQATRFEPAIRRIQGVNLPPDVEDRPFFTNPQLANNYASELIGRRRIIPQTGSLPIKREWLDDAPKVGGGDYGQVREGERYYWESDRYGIEQVMRINAITWEADKSGQAKLETEYERALNTQQQFVAPPVIELPPDFLVEPVAIINKRAMELPSGLKTLAVPQICILGQRPRLETIGFEVYASVDNTVFDDIAMQTSFAARGLIASANYPNSTADLDTTVGMIADLYGPDQDTIDVSQTDSQRDDKTVLVYHPASGDLCSLGQVIPLGSGRFKHFLLRKLYGTGKHTWNIGDEVWFIPRAAILPIGNRNFAPGATRYFKLASFTMDGVLDIATVSSFSYSFANVPAVGSVFNVDLESTSGVAADNSPDIRIIAKWDGLLDQDIFQFEVAWQKDGDAGWQSSTPIADPSGHNVFDFEVTPGTLYNVRITPVNRFGEPGAPVTQQILSATLAPFTVTGLELTGQGADTVSTQPDFCWDWRLNSPSVPPDPAAPLTPESPDPLFDVFLVEIYAGEVGSQQIIDGVVTPIWKASTPTPRFIFRLIDNLAAGGPFPQVTIAVRARDIYKNVTPPAVLTDKNEKPGVILNPKLTTTLTGVNLGWTWSTDVDLIELQIFESTDPADPSPPLVGREAYPGTSHTVDGIPPDSAPRYFWGIEVDTFGNRGAAVFFGATNPGSPAGDVAISPTGGTITGPTTVSLTCPATPSAQIYWRADATTPTSADNLYDPASPPSVNATGDFSAIAKLGANYGNENTVHFTLDAGACAAPTFSPVGGTYSNAPGTLDVTVATATPGAQMRYTTDGSTPTSSLGTLIAGTSGVVTLPTGTTTLKAIAFKTGLTPSSVASATYTVILSGGGGGSAVDDPIIIPAPGTYKNGALGYLPIIIGTKAVGAQMRTTKDGTTPTSGSSGHGALSSFNSDTGSVVSGQTAKVIAYKNPLPNSNVVSSGPYTLIAGNDSFSQCPDPQILPAPDTYHFGGAGHLSVSIISASCGVGYFFYTLDGSTPSGSHGTRVNGVCFSLGFDHAAGASEDITIKVLAFPNNVGRGIGGPSNVMTFVFHLRD